MTDTTTLVVAVLRLAAATAISCGADASNFVNGGHDGVEEAYFAAEDAWYDLRELGEAP